jgi:hypothetical protein
VPERDEFLPADQRLLEGLRNGQRVFKTLDEALAGAPPAVKVQAAGTVRVLPRVKPGAVVVHLLNYGYVPERDDVTPLSSVQVQLDPAGFGLAGPQTCEWITPDADRVPLSLRDGRVDVPRLALWGLLAIRGASTNAPNGGTPRP